MTFNELARRRYSCRNISTRPVEQEKLDAIIEAGIAAPKLQALLPDLQNHDLVAIFPVGYADASAKPAAWHTFRRSREEAVKVL